jgi:hypothetical protein
VALGFSSVGKETSRRDGRTYETVCRRNRNPCSGSSGVDGPDGLGPGQDDLVRDENGDGHRRGDRCRNPHGHAQESGRHCRVDGAGPDIKRFAELKVGDKVTARYYENVVVRLKKPGEPDVASATKATTPAEQVLPGGTKARQMTITASITAINPEVPSITFAGPTGLKYTSKVVDKAALANVKVGDKFDIVWTEAVLVSVEPGK